MNKRKSLGRGLEALLSSAARPPPPPAAAQNPAPPPPSPVAAPTAAPPPGTPVDAALRELPVDLLSRGRYQPRVDMREETLAELAESIRAQGVVQPIVVRPLAGNAGDEPRYEIIAGERRWRAAQLAGLQTVPAIVRDIPDEAAVAVALIENIQRENLNALEEARSLERLVNEFGLTHAAAAEAVGRSRAAVSNLLRLLELPRAVREMVERRELDMGHARAILGIESAEEQLEAAQRIVKQALSVRAAEQLARRAAGASGAAAGRRRKSAAGASDPDVRRLETELADTLGAEVSIEHGTKGGRVVIRYNGLEELEGILAHIK